MPSVGSHIVKAKGSSVWKSWTNFWAKHSDTWKKPLAVYTKNGGSWVKVWDERPEVTLVSRTKTFKTENYVGYTEYTIVVSVKANGFNTTSGAYGPTGAVLYDYTASPETVTANATTNVTITGYALDWWGTYPTVVCSNASGATSLAVT